MGRETTFLLAVLGVLGGAFMGVLSMKLLVPRPPIGAGPDVDPQEIVATSHDLVEPPALEPRVPAMTSPAVRRDPFVTRSAFTAPDAEIPDEIAPPPAAPVFAPPPVIEPDPADAALAPPRTEPAAATPIDAFPRRPPPPPSIPADDSREAPAAPIAGSYVTAPGDTWWSIAERAYGDGRLYRALFSWNRRLDPRVSTTPGTRLEIPPQPKLAAAWPKLMP
ncbi:MAG: LysM peptidoglycan-binding domain-containing protein [Pirellulales bacterium]